MKEFRDFLPISLANEIHDKLTCNEFPWYWLDDVTANPADTFLCSSGAVYVHLGAAVLPAEGWGGQTGGGDGEYMDAETDALGLLRAWLGEALVGVEAKQLGVAEGVVSSLRSWLGAQLGALELRLGEKLGEQTEQLIEEMEGLDGRLGAAGGAEAGRVCYSLVRRSL